MTSKSSYWRHARASPYTLLAPVGFTEILVGYARKTSPNLLHCWFPVLGHWHYNPKLKLCSKTVCATITILKFMHLIRKCESTYLTDITVLISGTDKEGIWWKLKGNFAYFSIKTYVVVDDSNEYPQHMFLWWTDKNYPSIIFKYPPYLFFWMIPSVGQTGLGKQCRSRRSSLISVYTVCRLVWAKQCIF